MGGDNTCVFVRVTELTDDLFDRFYHTVLAPAFPADIETVRALHYDPSPRVPGLVALRAGDPVGGVLGELYDAVNVVLLAYLAVRADCRGDGIGSVLLERSLLSWQERLSPAAIVAEVEDPRGHSSGPHGDPSARLRFYERAGGKMLPLRYFQPSVGGKPRVHGMLLVCLDRRRAGLPKNTVVSLLDEYMETAEGFEARRSDAEYLDLRAQVDAWPDEVPLWPLSRLEQLPAADQSTSRES
jgi:GNAT superfamily N-acetyltransferase